jgi:hypothetical protein
VSDLIQRARDIVADLYHARETVRLATTGAPDLSGHEGQIKHSPESWLDHVNRWCDACRRGAYDSNIEVQAAFRALSEREFANA